MYSIVIPALNEKENLSELLPSIAGAAALHAYEVLVVLAPQNTDGSEDLPGGDAVQFMFCPLAGRGVQMNYGAARARGQVLVFLHADTRIPSDFFGAMDQVRNRGNQAGLFAFDFYPPSPLLKINAYFTAKKGLFTGAGDQCLFIEKTPFDALGGFNPEQVLMEDFEFFDRMKKADISYGISPSRLLVSARKYQYNSYLRVNAVNMILFSLYKMGVRPARLKKVYCLLLKGPQIEQLN
jgi:rSAM/selenodomain-associated transferase 2